MMLIGCFFYVLVNGPKVYYVLSPLAVNVELGASYDPLMLLRGAHMANA